MAREVGKILSLFFVCLAWVMLAGCASAGGDSGPSERAGDPSRLMAAVRANEDRKVLDLLSQGLAPDYYQSNGESPLMVAAANGNRRIARLLLAAGAEVNARDDSGSTPVIRAADHGHLAVVRTLLAAGANVNVSQDGQSLLMRVVTSGDLLTAEMLLAAGADVHYRGADGQTALDLARAGNHQDLGMLLVQAGAAR